MSFKYHLSAILVIALLLLTAGCSTKNVGALGADTADDIRAAAGVTLGGYEVIRYNALGVEDPALNGSLDLRLEGRDLVISVDDAELNNVALLVNYDGTGTHPGAVEFHGVFAEEGMLSASFTAKSGIAGLGSAPIGGTDIGSFSGEYATVSFEPGTLRTVSAPGDVHHGNVGETVGKVQNLFGAGDTTARTASVSWTAAFHTGDGDMNSETNSADLTPIALFFGQNTATNWAAEVADYDDNGEVNLADITTIVLFFGERTSGFTVDFADNDGSGRAAYPDSPLMWVDAAPPAGLPVQDDFFSVFINWGINVSDTTPFSYDDLSAFDTNADGFINAYVSNATFTPGTPPVVDQMGTEAFVQVPVTNVPVENHASVLVTDYSVRVTGADVGDVFGAGALSGEATANTTLSFALENVMGTFDGEPFDKDTLPTAGDKTMTQAQYDDIFDSCQALLEWTFSDSGDAAIRRTGSWMLLNSGQSGTITGDPGPGVVFPDDDPQSEAPADPEGMLGLSLPAGGEGVYPWDTEIHCQVLSILDYDLTFDITPDPIAGVISLYDKLELELVVENDLLMDFTFGTDGAPVDLTGTLLQLVPIDPATGFSYDPADRNWLTLDYVVETETPVVGQFTIFVFGGEGQVFSKVNGGDLQSGTEYAARLNVSGTWTSINQPDDVIGTRDFQAPPIVVLPEICGPEVTELQLFPEDPQVRRNGEMSFNLLSGLPVFADEEAFDDILKIRPAGADDAEFPIEYEASTLTTYPSVVVVAGNSPGAITGPEDPNNIPGQGVIKRQGNKITLDIAAIPRPTEAGVELDYAFRVFTKDGQEFGEGTFTMIFLDFGTPEPVGIDWSVNLFDRAEAALGDRDHVDAGHRVDGPSVNTPTPDVLWFEFSGGWLYGGLFREDVYIELEEIAGVETMPMPIRVEIAGVTPEGDVLAFHPVHLDDFFNPIEPTGGILRNGFSYLVKIREITSALPPYTYTSALTVIGSPWV